MATPERTIDPLQISSPSQIPPKGAIALGRSPQWLIDVYGGTMLGDTDAQPSATELLTQAPDTGGTANADYIYARVSALYGGAQLPSFKGPSGNEITTLVFVSGSSQGSYGAFHFNIPGDQVDFDRIVVDSLNASGTYSAGSGLPMSMAFGGAALKGRTGPLNAYRGPADLLAIADPREAWAKGADPVEIAWALACATHSMRALRRAVQTRNASTLPDAVGVDLIRGEQLDQLTHANRDAQELVRAAVGALGGRQYLSTALFAAELVECFQTLTRSADPGRTDGEAVSRFVAYKLATEISLIPGFNSAVVQRWWSDGHPDFVNNNSQDDRSVDGNGAGVIFLAFLNDFLGVPLDTIIQHMPKQGGAPLGDTYINLVNDDPKLADVAGKSGESAFQKMVAVLLGITNPDGTLNLPANGNPFPSMPGAKQGGLIATR